MKKRLIFMRQDERIYIRDIDVKELKPLMKLANIELKTTEQGKYTGAPRHYLPLSSGFAFLVSLTSDYELIFR